MLQILQALVWKFSQGHFAMRSFGVDGTILKSFEGLGIIPIDILEEGSQRTVRYLLDLFQSPEADPLYRSKLMVVGFAEIGKTSMLDCLFPLTGILFSREVNKQFLLKDQVVWHDCFLKLRGNNLTQKEVIRDTNLTASKKGEDKKKKVREYFGTVRLTHKSKDAKVGLWSIVRIDGHEKPGFRISGPNGFVRELYCEEKDERDGWFDRIDGFLKKDRTHGIDIREIDCSSHPVVKGHFVRNKLKGKLGLSVWDFAGRMVARLSGLIEGDCAMRDHVLFRKGETQANVTVGMSSDQFLIEVRSDSLENGDSLLKEIRESISGVLDSYSKKSLVEGIRSPYSGKIIPLDLIRDWKGGESFQFEGEPTIPTKMIQELGGLISSKTLTRKPVAEGTPEWTRLSSCLRYLGGDATKITSAFDLEDPRVRAIFDAHREFVFQQHRSSPGLFNKKDHQKMADAGLRAESLKFLDSKYQSFSTSDFKGNFGDDDGDEGSSKTRIVPMVHGTREAVGWKIAQSGFGTVASLDAGWYGQGIYFPSRIEYAQYYANLSIKDCPPGHRVKVLLITLVNPGNAFPVTEDPFKPESLKGKERRLGYQSHYTVVDQSGCPLKETSSVKGEGGFSR